MENSFIAVFDEIPCTIVQDTLSNFRVTLRIRQNPQFLNGVSSKNMYIHALENVIEIENLLSEPFL